MSRKTHFIYFRNPVSRPSSLLNFATSCAQAQILRSKESHAKDLGIWRTSASIACEPTGTRPFQGEMKRLRFRGGWRCRPGERAGSCPDGQLVENKAHKGVLGLIRYCGTSRKLHKIDVAT